MKILVYSAAIVCLLVGSSDGFSQVSITQLPNATTPLNGTEVVPGVQNGQTVQIPEIAIGIQGPASATSGHVATFNGSSGRIIQDGGNLGPYGEALLGQLPGTTTNDSASSGNIGQYVFSDVTSGSPFSMSSGTPANMTSISLTAGDWDVSLAVAFVGTATSVLFVQSGISATSATIDTTLGRFTNSSAGNLTTTSLSAPVPPRRFSLSTTTTLYAVVNGSFSGGGATCTAYGTLSARRVR